MAYDPDVVRVLAQIVCIALVSILEKYFIFKRPLQFWESFSNIGTGVFAGPFFALLLQSGYAYTLQWFFDKLPWSLASVIAAAMVILIVAYAAVVLVRMTFFQNKQKEENNK